MIFEKIDNRKSFKYIIIPAIIFLFSYTLRIHFFSGFILCDDLQEFATVKHVLLNGPNLKDQLHLRFGVWLFNLVFFKLFGISEMTFFLPTILMSSSIPLIGYLILTYKSYKTFNSFLGSLLISSAPFEVLIGGLRANDLIFSWILSIAILFFIILEKKPIFQGIITGFLLWIAFYVKLWVVYVFPVLFIYYMFQLIRKGWIKGALSCFITSFLLHLITSIYWKIRIGGFLPFITNHAATYPVNKSYLKTLFMIYPNFLFNGSEFSTTLFGIIPSLLIFLICIKIFLIFFSKKLLKINYKFDKLDYILFSYYVTFFLLLNFFPNTFKFDQYYSAPRIFRYLTPLSFPMTLHIVKLILDFSEFSNKYIFKFKKEIIQRIILLLLFVSLIFLNIIQVKEATLPGRIYRESILKIIRDIKLLSPPKIIPEAWLSFFLREIYLKDVDADIVTIYDTHHVTEYETWLNKHQSGFPNGTVLITGLGSCVHYGGHQSGFRLNYFKDELDTSWKLYREYNNLTYLPSPETTKLWILSGK